MKVTVNPLVLIFWIIIFSFVIKLCIWIIK